MSAGGPKVTVQVPVRIDDLTPAMHVGNASVVRILEEGRALFLGHPDGARRGFHGGLLEVLDGRIEMLIAQQTIEYVDEIFYAVDPLHITFWLGHLGTSSATVCMEVYREDPAAGTGPVVRAEAVMVLIDPQTGRPWPMDETVRTRFAAHLDTPVALRPRPGTGA